LLDEWRGFHPHTTWSTCTFEHAIDLLRGCDREVVKLGVLRTYFTRHGAGPFPTEDASLDAILEPHNAMHPFQGKFRRGWFDAVLARYAIEACDGIDALALTHVDALARIDRWRMATSYATIDRLPLAEKRTLSTGLTDLVSRAEPRYEFRADAIAAIEESIGKTCSILVDGPTASHARFVDR
jgi:adenylosuccinate synthase